MGVNAKYYFRPNQLVCQNLKFVLITCFLSVFLKIKTETRQANIISIVQMVNMRYA